MTSKDITSVAIKIFGILLAVNTILYVPSLIILNSDYLHNECESYGESALAIVGSFIILGLAVSFVLFKLANSIASKTSDSTVSKLESSEAFLLQVLGVYFIVTALSVLPSIGNPIIFDTSETTHDKFFWSLGYIFQLAIGLYLLIKPPVWIDLLKKLRGSA